MISNVEMWKHLELNPPTGETLAARLVLPELSKKLYAGIDANKIRHLLVSVSNDDECRDSQSRGLSVATRDLVIQGSEPKRYIDITCQDNSGHVIFDAIASEIAEKLDDSGESKEVITNVIGKWRRFWGQPPRDLLTYEELIGLFAELWFLCNWLFPRIDKADAINRWRGPFSSRHDFEWSGKSIEIKATTNVQHRMHKIHGIDQLSAPENGELLLFSLRLREEQGAGNTLPSIISLCQEKLKDNIDALSKFENILAIAGYSPLHNDEYLKFKFRVVDEKLYNVTNEFPRIIKDSFAQGIPPGVGMIEYTINLDGFDDLCLANSPNDSIEL